MKACVEFGGARDPKGYGRKWFRDKVWFAHRVAWVEANGSIPNGMCVLHRCDNPPCINVEHLFLGTKADNLADMRAKGRGYVPENLNDGKTHCKHGHEFTTKNTYVRPYGGRSCRTCGREEARRRRLQVKGG
jgi:hypothetical protein